MENILKKHKKHKKEKYDDKVYAGERPQSLKLVLKVPPTGMDHNETNSNHGVSLDSLFNHSSGHKKSKKKKKKKDREKDKDRHERKKKHHHKKLKLGDESSQDGGSSMVEDLIVERIAAKRIELKEDSAARAAAAVAAANREQRLCVQLFRQKHDKTSFQKMLEFLQKELEKKDPKQVFAWPVTDQIAPGYSQTISKPMDFSTMRQKIEDDEYPTLESYSNDLRLMCNNAMIYNHPETIYYKAAKKLLHAGLKILSPIKIIQAAPLIPTIKEVSQEQLGFDLSTGLPAEVIPNVRIEENDDKETIQDEIKSEKRKINDNKDCDEMEADEILRQAQLAAKASSEKLSLKRPKTSMSFVRQQTDGSTSLAILIPSNYESKGKERPITLGQLVGKLNHGSGQLQGYKDEKKHLTKTVKPLNYCAFGSYAPSYDSTFANLTKDESDLLLETYGDENARSYAESILNFAKDCDYTSTMVDNLLDLLTGGEHRNTKALIDEHRKLKEDEEKLKEAELKKDQNKKSTVQSVSAATKVEIDKLKSLNELGIDTSFLEEFDEQNSVVQEKLDQTSALIEKLQQVQNDRLSAPLPPHLSQVVALSETEVQIAEKITESLTELAKQVPPSAIVPVSGIRKAMGIVPDNVESSIDNVGLNGIEESCVSVGQLDLESELREFLESDTALSSFPLNDDKTIEEMLCEP